MSGPTGHWKKKIFPVVSVYVGIWQSGGSILEGGGRAWKWSGDGWWWGVKKHQIKSQVKVSHETGPARLWRWSSVCCCCRCMDRHCEDEPGGAALSVPWMLILATSAKPRPKVRKPHVSQQGPSHCHVSSVMWKLLIPCIIYKCKAQMQGWWNTVLLDLLTNQRWNKPERPVVQGGIITAPCVCSCESECV